MKRVCIFLALVAVILWDNPVHAQTRAEVVIDTSQASPWHLPSVTLDNGVIRMWNMDTLMCEPEMLMVFVSGAEFAVSSDDLDHYATRYRRQGMENGVMTVHRVIRPVIAIPLQSFCLVDPEVKDSYLPASARPDSLYIFGVVKEGGWFFQRMLISENDEYVRMSWYYQARNGEVHCHPSDHPQPWKYIERRNADL